MMTKLLPLMALVGALSSAVAQATPTPISGTGLQDALTAAGANVDVTADQYQEGTGWQVGATGLSVSNLLFEFAGGAATNAFGIYDVYDKSNTLQIFSGAASSGNIGLVANTSDNTFCAGMLFSGWSCSTFTSETFGFYLQTDTDIFYSDMKENADGLDHMVAYQGGSGHGQINGNWWLANEFVFGWEDLNGGGDLDYEDFVVVIESVIGVPEPATVGLLGLGLIGLGLRRKALVTRS